MKVPLQAQGVARFTFAELCVEPLGASDYIALAQRFHTLIIDGVPVMDFDRRNHAKRFIALIDTLYERHVKLVASAEAEPEALYLGGTGPESLEFKRTASRLIEMRSQAYLALPQGRADSSASGATTGSWRLEPAPRRPLTDGKLNRHSPSPGVPAAWRLLALRIKGSR